MKEDNTGHWCQQLLEACRDNLGRRTAIETRQDISVSESLHDVMLRLPDKERMELEVLG